MSKDLFTIVCDFEGGTFVTQVSAADQSDAVHRWAIMLEAEQSMGEPSTELARLAIERADPPVAVDGLTGVWCWTASIGASLALANIIRSAD